MREYKRRGKEGFQSIPNPSEGNILQLQHSSTLQATPFPSNMPARPADWGLHASSVVPRDFQRVSKWHLASRRFAWKSFCFGVFKCNFAANGCRDPEELL